MKFPLFLDQHPVDAPEPPRVQFEGFPEEFTKGLCSFKPLSFELVEVTVALLPKGNSFLVGVKGIVFHRDTGRRIPVQASTPHFFNDYHNDRKVAIRAAIYTEVYSLLRHELQETMRIDDGDFYSNPHPEELKRITVNLTAEKKK